MTPNREGRWGVPVATLGVLSLSALATSTSVGDLLLDLEGASTSGAWWRPLTGHLVHGSIWHFLLNLAVLAPLGAIRERRVGSARFAAELLLLASVVALGVRLIHAGFGSYCGLSGLVYGVIGLTLLDARTRVAALVLVALALKTGLELWSGGWLSGGHDLRVALGVVYLPGSHVAGLVGASLYWVAFCGRRRLVSPRLVSDHDRDWLHILSSKP